MKIINNTNGSLSESSIALCLIAVIAVISVTSSGKNLSSVFESASSKINETVFGVRSCAISNGAGTQTRNDKMEWSSCTAQSCDTGFHIENSNCTPNAKSVAIPNGTSHKTWENGRWTTNSIDCDEGYKEENLSCILDGGNWVFQFRADYQYDDYPSDYWSMPVKEFSDDPSGQACHEIGQYGEYIVGWQSIPMRGSLPVKDVYQCN